MQLINLTDWFLYCIDTSKQCNSGKINANYKIVLHIYIVTHEHYNIFHYKDEISQLYASAVYIFFHKIRRNINQKNRLEINKTIISQLIYTHK